MLQGGGSKENLLAGVEEGEEVPGRQGLRSFRDLMSWKEAFLENREKKEAIQVRVSKEARRPEVCR